MEHPGAAEHQANDLYDITIIGAGPAGLFGTFYSGLREMKTKLIDALDEPGGQLAALYPEKFIYDVPGFPKIISRDLVKQLAEQAAMWKPALCLGERVESLAKEADGTFILRTNKGSHRSRTVIIAGGVGAFTPKKLPGPEFAQYEDKGLYYSVKEKAIFRGKNILVVGGGDSAVDWALNLKDYARHVTLIHRRDQFRALPASVTELTHSSVDVRVFHELKGVSGAGRVQQAVIFDNRTKEEVALPVDAVILTLGFNVDLGPIKNWGLDMVGTRYIRVNSKMQTNIPGVYSAGDIAAEEGVEPLNLIAVSFGQICYAINFAYQYLNPGAKAFPGHSSEKKF